MSAAIEDLEAQAPVREKPLRRYISAFTVALCSSLYILPFMRLLLPRTDEGLLVSGAVRVAHGQVFARDFFEIVGPGTFYWVAMFFKLFGATFLAERICLFVSSLGTALLMYFLSRRVCERYRILPCIILAGTYFGGLWPTISHHVDSNFFALLSVACMTVWQDKRKGGLLIAAGVLAGATTCFLQPKGVLLLLALLLWLWVQRRRGATSLSSLGVVAGGYLGAVGLVLAYFWSRHALWDLIYANVVWPRTHYGATNIVPYAQGIIREYWKGWAVPVGRVRWTAVLATVLVTPLGFVAALPGLVPILGLWRRKSPAKPEIILYWLCAWALWFAEFHRKDIYHLVFGSPMLIILCVHYLEEYQAKVADLALQILAITATCLAGFNFLLVLSAHPTATQVGTVATFKSDPVLSLLQGRVVPGEEIFVYPYAPIYYFLTGTTNPTRYSGLGYNYNSASEFQQVVQILDQHRVKYVVWDTAQTERDLKLYFPSLKPPRPDELIIEPYLHSHYDRVQVRDGIWLMERKSERN